MNKTRKAISKRFKVLSSGRIKCAFAEKKHHAIQKNSRMLRQKRGMRLLSKTETIAVRKLLVGHKKVSAPIQKPMANEQLALDQGVE